MATLDRCCTVAPYFKVHPGKLEAFKSLCERFVERASTEEKCLYYGFTFNGQEAHCREGYVDGEGVLMHLKNVGDLLEQWATVGEITKFEIHGPAEEIEKLRGPLTSLKAEFFIL